MGIAKGSRRLIFNNDFNLQFGLLAYSLTLTLPSILNLNTRPFFDFDVPSSTTTFL
jgi:hypothetical protein